MPRAKKKSAKPKQSKHMQSLEKELEIEFLAGLEEFVIKELRLYRLEPIQTKRNSLRLAYRGKLNKLNKLKTIVAAYLLISYKIPRPKAILGQENFSRLIKEIKTILALNDFKSFRINAAGRGSSVFKRIAHEIAKATKLKYDAKGGELLLRFRKAKNTWEVLIRLSPKALSARNWRACNMAGGLNATVAYAMNDLAQIKTGDVYLNAMCGSGTLLIENNRAKKLIAIDNSQEALDCAASNIKKAKIDAELILSDALNMPFENASIDVITADMPWGDATGRHSENAQLYQGCLEEWARASSKQARLIILTHELRIFEKLIRAQDIWQIKKEFQVYHGGHYPKIYLLKKLGS